MSTDADTALVQALSHNHTFNIILVGSLSLILYDNIICFPMELRLVWKSKWTLGKLLYIGCRYVTPLSLLPLIPLRMKTDCTISSNRGWYYALICLSFFGDLCPQILMCLRTYVLYHGKNAIKWFIILLYATEATTLFTMMCIIIKKSSFLELPIHGVPCIFSVYTVSQKPILVMYSAAFAYEVTLWSMSLLKLLPSVLAGQRNLTLILFRDGMLYFTVVTLLCAPQLILYASLDESRLDIASLIEPIIVAFSAILSSRLILNLRAKDSGDSYGETQNITISDFRVR